MEQKPASISREKWLYAAGLAGVLLAYLLLIHLPNRRAMASLRAELNLKQHNALLASSAGEIAAAQQGIAEASEYLRRLRRETNPADAGKLFGDISAIARQTGVRTKRFDPSPSIEHEDLMELPLAIECDGTFEQLFELLNRLESLPQLLWISSLQMQANPSQQEELHCRVNLEIFADKGEISD